MTKGFRHFSIAVVLALLFSAVAPAVVFADSGSPPPPDGAHSDPTDAPTDPPEEDPGETPTPEPTVEDPGESGQETPTDTPAPEETPTGEPPGESTPADEQPTEEPSSEKPPADEQPTEEPPSEEPPSEEPPVEEQPLMEQVPDDTTIVVLNEDGEPEPLVTQEAADAIEEGDPIWCPAGQEPTPGANGCTPSFASFDELLSFLEVNEDDPAYQMAGTIYVETGDYTGGESNIDFNNYNFNTLNTFDLTLQGGWNTSAEPAEAVEPEARTNFAAPIIIGSAANPWIGSITINQFNIQGVGSNTALTVHSQNDVTLTNSEFNQNESGMELNAGGNVTVDTVQADNNKYSGAQIEAGGDVQVANSTFSNNGIPNNKKAEGQGLQIPNAMNVTLSDVQASNNERFGADINATGAVGITNSIFSGNKGYTCTKCGGTTYYGYGLKVVSLDGITLESVQANDNNLFGADLQAEYDVQITDAEFNDNGVNTSKFVAGFGLEINSNGFVILDDVEANRNNLFGADIETIESVFISNSFFNGNRAYTCSKCGGKNYYGYGLNVVADDSIYLTGVSASDNNICGTCLAAGNDIYVTDSVFSNNGVQYGSTVLGFGMVVNAGGDVNFYGVEANNNKLYGANIDAGGMVSISSSVFSGNKAYTSSRCKGKKFYGYGLQVVSLDAINLYDVTAEDNYIFGADLDAAGNISVYQASFSNNGVGYGSSAYGYGLKASSEMDVYLDAVQASANNIYGAAIESGGSVALSNSVFSGNQYAYVNHCGCSKYYGFGLQVIAADAISMFDVEASDNNLFGARLRAGGDVDIFAGTFNNNQTGSNYEVTGYGLDLVSNGNVSIYEIEASNNMLYGASIQANGLVDVQVGLFNNNKGITYTRCGKTYHGYGLKVVTLDAVTLNEITAEGNNRFGAYVETDGDVSVYDSNFNANGYNTYYKIDGYGLQINSGGNVMLDGVQANDNKLFGANILADGTVSVLNSQFNHNQGTTCTRCGKSYWGFGLQINAIEMIYLSNVQANENYKYGASLDTNGDVEVLDSSFNQNGVNTSKYVEGFGLEIESGGNVVLDGVTANENKIFGASIEADGTVTVSNSEFSRNQAFTCSRCSSTYYGYGLIINAMDLISLSNVLASENYRNGALITAHSDLSISDSSFTDNGYARYGYSGLMIIASGNVTLTNVEATGSGNNGVYVRGDACATVVVNDGTFSENNAYGIKVSYGTLALNGTPVFSGNGHGDTDVYAGNCAP